MEITLQIYPDELEGFKDLLTEKMDTFDSWDFDKLTPEQQLWKKLDHALGGKQVFLNCYLDNLVYGGSEEGGWWYTIEEPVYSVEFGILRDVDLAAALAKKKEWEEGEYSNEGRPSMHHSNSRGEYRVCIEDHEPVASPETTPHYE